MRSTKTVFTLFALLPGLALAWGGTGHRVVCEIAFEELSDATRSEVERLLDLDSDFETFADACLFADTPERIREFEHFMNVPRSFSAITTDECPLTERCILTAIRGDAAVLADPDATDGDKLLALKLLGHWVGDIHQPLHVSFEDDRGANYVDVDIDMPDANLHAVWDTTIVARTLGDDYRQIAADLRSAIPDRERNAWKQGSPVDWANESFQLTISESVGYCMQKPGACWSSADNVLLNDGGPRPQMVISDDYLRRHSAIVQQRLLQAGVRLAALLEDSLR